MGIDPGLATTGYGIIEHTRSTLTLVSYGVITTGAREPFGKRIDTIHVELARLLKKYKPTTVGIEKLFFSKNVKTALSVGEARGVAVLTVWQQNVPIREFTPMQIKQALTGYGLATKSQIQKMVQRQLNLKTIPNPDDAADALAIAICCSQTKIF